MMTRTIQSDGIVYTFTPPVTAGIKNADEIVYVLNVRIPFDGLVPRTIMCFNPRDGQFFRGNIENIYINEQEILR